MGNLKIASLFCGCGGTDIGFTGGFNFLGKYYSKNPVKIVYANDIEKEACDIFDANFKIKSDNRDIKSVSSNEIPDHDILTGGFPCQSFSIVAQNPKRLGFKDDKGKLFFEMCRILRDKQPKCFVAENVKGLISANDGMAFPLIISEFEKCGYSVHYKLMNSVHFGVPQKRERVFIVGFRNDLDVEFKFPDPILTEEDFIPLSSVVFPNSEIQEKYYFSDKAVQGMLKANPKMNKGRAQDLSKPCNTVGSHLAKVSLNSTDPVLEVDGRYRRFTPREVARIQSFPDEFKLIGSDASQYRALGNAIPPVLMWYIAKAIVKALKNAKIKEEPERQIAVG